MNTIVYYLIKGFFAQHWVGLRFGDLDLFVCNVNNSSFNKSNYTLKPRIIFQLSPISWTIDQLYLHIRTPIYRELTKLLSFSLLEWNIWILLTIFLAFSSLKFFIVFFTKCVYQVLNKTWFSNSWLTAYHYIKDDFFLVLLFRHLSKYLNGLSCS